MQLYSVNKNKNNKKPHTNHSFNHEFAYNNNTNIGNNLEKVNLTIRGGLNDS